MIQAISVSTDESSANESKRLRQQDVCMAHLNLWQKMKMMDWARIYQSIRAPTEAEMLLEEFGLLGHDDKDDTTLVAPLVDDCF
jgi:hypothetical protein